MLGITFVYPSSNNRLNLLRLAQTNTGAKLITANNNSNYTNKL